MKNILSVIDPPECAEHGVPLDWERCRRCGGDQWVDDFAVRDDTGAMAKRKCPDCWGHGSLRAAALAWLIENRTVGPWGAHAEAKAHANGTRCEGCGHPMSEGTWEGEPPRHQPWNSTTLVAERENPLAIAESWPCIHYSPCDEGCRHGGPGREVASGTTNFLTLADDPWAEDGVGYLTSAAVRVEASWRQVDVRTLGWPHDLRPEKLSVLCLRCYAARSPQPQGGRVAC